MDNKAKSAWGVRQAVSLIILVGISLLGNVLAPQLFTGFNYLFGSIGVILVLRLFGIIPAIIAALIAALWCKQLFGHFYPLIWLGLEPLFVGIAIRRYPKLSIIMIDMGYWLLIGMPLIFFFFLLVFKVSALGTAAAALMYATIGIANALIATLLLNQLSLEHLVWPGRSNSPVNIAQFIFHLLMLAIVLPAILVMVITGRSREANTRQKMFDLLEIKARQIGQKIRQNLYKGVLPKNFEKKMLSEDELKVATRILKEMQPNQYMDLHLMANNGRLIASTNSELQNQTYYNPVETNKLLPTERQHIYQLIPSFNEPLPLWQRAGANRFIRINYFPATTMYAIAETPFSPYQAEILRGHRNSLAALLLYLAIGAVTSCTVSRRIAVPLVALSKITSHLPERLAEQDLVWPDSNIAEIKQLTENSQQMSHTLGQQFMEIAQINADLERRVTERTQELTESNSSLKQEIDERTRAEQQRDHLMRELETKNRELESIIYVSSHDLRSPLVNIQGFSRKLGKNCVSVTRTLNEIDLPEEKKKELLPVLEDKIPRSIEFIIGSVEKMEGLLSGLLRVSRLGQILLDIQNLDMNLLMSKIADSLAYQIETADARVVIDELLPCSGDEIQVSQVFTNLLDNAIKYRSPDRQLQIHVSCKASGSEIEYSVKDNGIGIHSDYHEQIWEIFQRINPRNIQGEGLGLTAARRILDRLNGSIAVESTEGEGSRFIVKLPQKKV